MLRLMTALLMNEVPSAEFLFIGPTQEIADLAFQQAAGMVEADPDGYLAKRFHVVDHKKTIRDRRNKAFVKVNGPFDIQRRAIVGLHLDLCRAVSSEQGAVGFGVQAAQSYVTIQALEAVEKRSREDKESLQKALDKKSEGFDRNLDKMERVVI